MRALTSYVLWIYLDAWAKLHIALGVQKRVKLLSPLVHLEELRSVG